MELNINAKKETEFSYEIIKPVAVLSQRGSSSLEVNFISYNKAPAKLDVRRWQKEGTQKKMLKGITLNKEEATKLKEVLTAIV